MRPLFFATALAALFLVPALAGSDLAVATGAPASTRPATASPAPTPAADAASAVTEADVIVYGGTSAGVMAAVQARRMGKTAVIVGPDRRLGGLSSGGLGFTDTGDKSVIGGLGREFYHRVWRHYQRPEAWVWQERESYGNRGQGTEAIDGDARTMWIFEPHVAEQIFEDYIAEYAIPVHRDQWLDREPGRGVAMTDGRITAITMLSGRRYVGKVFIDATYEGDLMAAAGVDYHVGREANSQYDETWNGVQVGVLHHRHWFMEPVDPYVIPGEPSSGALPRISVDPPGEKGEADHRVQAYCFRMCLTDVPENRIPFPKPEGYDPAQYELLLRVFESGWRETFHKFDPIPNSKTDTNNHGPFSTDNIGFNYDYPDGSYERRAEIFQEHVTYQQGLMYFIANDPRVPEDVRSRMSQWGLAKDEFPDTGGWPHQLYVREARRMVGRYVMTENELLKRRPTPESIGMGSYGIDSHNVQRYIKPDGFVQNEGDIGVSTNGPYQIALGSIQPRQEQCENLLVPVCVSSTHIAFGSIRMEPVFMILGQSAATVAALAIDGDLAVQEVEYRIVRERLLTDGQILEGDEPSPPSGAMRSEDLEGVVVDDREAIYTGNWETSDSIGPFVDFGYRHDRNTDKGAMAARFEADLAPGRYDVRVFGPSHDNRATNTPVTVAHRRGEATVTLDQRRQPPAGQTAVSIGVFDFQGKAVVTISNAGTDGYVVVDAVQFVPVRP